MIDKFEDLRELKRKEKDIDIKSNVAKETRSAMGKTPTTEKFQDAVLADLDAIKAKLGI